MTTIVYANGILAADRRVTDGSTIVQGRYRKITRTDDGYLAGYAGACVSGYAFLKWARGNRKTKAPSGDYIGILIPPKGQPREYERGKLLPPSNGVKFHAYGSGSHFALGALCAGATAMQAVAIAARMDSKTGGGVDVLHLTQKV